MSHSYPITDAKAPEVEFALSEAVTDISPAIEGALAYSATKLGLISAEQVRVLLRSGDRNAHSYFEYSLANHLATQIADLDREVQAIYLYNPEATEDDVAFGEVPPTLIHLLVVATRKTNALTSLLAAIDRAVTERCADLLEKPDLVHFLDFQIVDTSEVNAQSGFGAFLRWLHHRPLPVWKR